jgi:cob(I)alamin adenosyltransferase
MYVYSIYGYGKGKTESAIGMIVRAVANGHKVLFVQFLKDGSSSEMQILKDKVDIMNSNTDKIILPKNKTEADTHSIVNLFNMVEKKIISGDYNLLVLDEVLVALDMGMISYQMVKTLINICNNKNIDVYMTGRVRDRATRLFVREISDSVTDAHCVKHMFDTYCTECDKSYPYHYTYCPDCGSELQVSRPCKLGRDY